MKHGCIHEDIFHFGFDFNPRPLIAKRRILMHIVYAGRMPMDSPPAHGFIPTGMRNLFGLTCRVTAQPPGCPNHKGHRYGTFKRKGGMMKLKPLTISVVLFVCFLVPATGRAVPIYYAVNGSIADNQQDTLQIAGGLYIDDQLRSWDGGQAVTSGSPAQYQYSITGYSLQVGNYAFSGKSGSLFMDSAIGDLMWFLNDGVGPWQEWGGENFYFFNADGSPAQVIDSSEHHYINSLSPLIELTGLLSNPNDPILLSDAPGFNMWLTRKSSDPVPEPPIILLFGVGLLATLAYRTVHREKQSPR
jgi:PEP-CTERM motif